MRNIPLLLFEVVVDPHPDPKPPPEDVPQDMVTFGVADEIGWVSRVVRHERMQSFTRTLWRKCVWIVKNSELFQM